MASAPHPISFREYVIVALLVVTAFGTALAGSGSVPPLDRDEPRFAQATHEMMERGNLLVPTFENQPRTKKPPGIYWLQMLSVSALGHLDPSPLRPYRLPSALGVAIAVGLTYGLARALAGPWVGMLSALALAASPIVLVEGHLATTDAMLLAAVLASQLFLWRLVTGPPRRRDRIGLGVAMALAGLLKGPVGIMFPILTALVFAGLSLKPRRAAVLVHPWTLAAAAVVFLPWPIGLWWTDQLDFVVRALREDFLPKLTSGVESHGAPPGLYLALLVLTLGPAIAFLPTAVVQAVRERADRWLFLVAWVVPSWLILEAVPTKLPHYVMPIYPALTMAVAMAVGADGLRGGRWSRTIGWTLGTICAGAFAVAVIGLAVWFDIRALLPAVIAVGLLAGFVALALRRPEPDQKLVRLSVGSLAFFTVVFAFVLPNLSPFGLSGRIAEQAKAAGSVDDLYVSGYNEPSLTFLLGKAPARGDASGAADFLAGHPDGRAVIVAKDLPGFIYQAGAEGLTGLCRIARLQGFNMGKGRPERFVVIGHAGKENGKCEPLQQ